MRVALLVLGGAGLLASAGLQGGSGPPSQAMTSVLVSARPLAGSTTLAPADVRSVRVPASEVSGALSGDLAAVVGRRLLVPLTTGTPLLAAVLGPATRAEPGQRLVPISLPGDHLAPGTRAGEEIDIVAAQPAPAGATGGRVDVVASGRIISVGPRERAGSGEPGGGGYVLVLVACEEPAAMRLLWAQAFARSMTAVVRPAVARPLPGSSGPST